MSVLPSEVTFLEAQYQPLQKSGMFSLEAVNKGVRFLFSAFLIFFKINISIYKKNKTKSCCNVGPLWKSSSIACELWLDSVTRWHSGSDGHILVCVSDNLISPNGLKSRQISDEYLGVCACACACACDCSLSQAMESMDIPCVSALVLNEDGTWVDTEEFFQTLPENTVLMVLDKNQNWTPCPVR